MLRKIVAPRLLVHAMSKRKLQSVNAEAEAASPAAALNEKAGGSLCRSAEKKLAEGFQFVIGVDEAGRGPLAGPVVAAACWVRNGVDIAGIRDSKQTKEEGREQTYAALMALSPSDLLWGVSVIDHKEIDDINILPH